MPENFIYCRKSSDDKDRQVLSIPSQQNVLTELADRRKFSDCKILTESRSAKAPGRPVFNEMMEEVYRGKVRNIICWKLDRLARNPIDGGALIWAVKQGLTIITPTHTFSLSEDNIILMYLEFGMAQKYIDDLSRNVKRGLDDKLEMGWRPGPARYGYINNMFKNKGEKDISPDPERFHLVRRMWDMMLTGVCKPLDILRIANTEWGFRTRQTKKRGGKALSKTSIYRIFTDPFYYGYFEYPRGSGHWWRGSHQPMISEEEFDIVQVLLGRKGKPKPVTHTFAYTGLIHCGECGSMVTAEEKHQLICSNCRYKFSYRNKDRCPQCGIAIEKMCKPTILNYTYYHCTRSKNPACKQRSIELKEVEAEIKACLNQIEILEPLRDFAVKYLHEVFELEAKETEHITKSQQKAYQDVLKRIDNLVMLKTSPENTDGRLLSDEEYGKQRLQLLQIKEGLEKVLRAGDTNGQRSMNNTRKTFDFACGIGERFANADPNTKKMILSDFQSNLTLKDKKLFIEAKKPFALIAESLSDVSDDFEAIEPEISFDNASENESMLLHSSLMSRKRNYVRTYNRKVKDLVRKVYKFFKDEESEKFQSPFYKSSKAA